MKCFLSLIHLGYESSDIAEKIHNRRWLVMNFFCNDGLLHNPHESLKENI